MITGVPRPRSRDWGIVIVGLALCGCAGPSTNSPGVASPQGGAGAETTGAAPASAPPAKEETIDERESRRLGRTWGWVAVGVGSVAGVVALGTSAIMLVKKGERDDHCDAAKICSQQGLDANGLLADLAGWNAGAWVVAAAGLGAGAVLLLTHPADREKGVQVGVRSTGAGARLDVWAAF